MSNLFDPLELGAFKLANRIVMAPLTRARSDERGVPNPLMASYYAQRASAGLIISEATGISREGLGWPNAPGLWSDEQAEGWKLVTDAVHRSGGRIVAVTDDQILSAQRDLAAREWVCVEPSSAAGVAGLLATKAASRR